MGDRVDLACLYRLKLVSELGPEGQLQVIDFCMNLGLIAKEYACPQCGKSMVLHERPGVIDGYEWICRAYVGSTHHVKRSLRKGSWFSESKLSLVDLLLMTEFFVRNRTQEDTIYELRVSSQTVCIFRSYFREMCVQFCVKESCEIGGVDKVVELGECMFGKRRFQRGNQVEGKWIFAGVEKGSNKCFFSVVKSRDKKALLTTIQTFVLPGTTIYSECWKSYGCLEDEEFMNLSAGNSLSFVNGSEGTWSLIKRQFPRRLVSNQFDSYLAEYLWRKLHSDDEDLMHTFLDSVKEVCVPQTSDTSDK
ncbi:unnamed protein product [Toxocara canis]|uniref:DDE_Tnp_IS1595 domain-containing protein n=2 Tax=Toxocara canis TaxID=6265 RepID=A0A183TZQ0_TOXCA|nr:unnamed protein product [Toxocara canis]